MASPFQRQPAAQQRSSGKVQSKPWGATPSVSVAAGSVDGHQSRASRLGRGLQKATRPWRSRHLRFASAVCKSEHQNRMAGLVAPVGRCMSTDGRHCSDGWSRPRRLLPSSMIRFCLCYDAASIIIASHPAQPRVIMPSHSRRYYTAPRIFSSFHQPIIVAAAFPSISPEQPLMFNAFCPIRPITRPTSAALFPSTQARRMQASAHGANPRLSRPSTGNWRIAGDPSLSSHTPLGHRPGFCPGG
jgi:hypothetical protein